MLTVSEARVILEDYVAACRVRDADYRPNPLLQKGLEYAQRFATNRNRGAIGKIREILAGKGCSARELALLGSLAPQTAEEARVLIPSLTEERFSDEDLTEMLREVATHAEFE